MRHSLLSLLLFITTSAVADDYKILYLSTESIEIGGKTLRKGDTFGDQSVIKWTLASQSMRIKRINGKGVKIKVVTKFLMQYWKIHSVPNGTDSKTLRVHTRTRPSKTITPQHDKQ